MPAKLDPTIATRSVKFDQAIALLELADREPRSYTELLTITLATNVIADRSGHGLKKSSFHRYWKSLEVLGLLENEKRNYVPSSRGREVLDNFRIERKHVGPRTQFLLRRCMLDSQVARTNFFDLFATAESTQPLRHTAAVALLPVRSGSSDRPRREYLLCNIETGHSYALTARQVQGIVWGLANWAVELGLADDLYARTQDGISAELAHIMFLVNPDRAAAAIAQEFDFALENLVQQGKPEYGNTVRLPISWLLYQLCPKLQITKTAARDQTIRWLKENQQRAFVEGASLPVVKNARGTRNGGSRITWKAQSPAHLEIAGRYYTNLFCQQE